ncbi:hypothetical protein EVAR_70669_1 [Eumeta japonica]|uniref:Uncharacterized protein n=1 Tax=Eumeta variegata TaxID=151549 RepID=A0A4C2AE14_EUMVA|nr:hypothetical protein EVAR_70669_1 [Eumeta japonica]
MQINEIDEDSQTAATTTLSPIDLDNGQDQNNMEIFSDYIDEENDKTQIKEDENLTTVTGDLFDSSEETASTEGSGLEPDFQETPIDQGEFISEDNSTTVAPVTTEEITQPDTTTNTDIETTKLEEAPTIIENEEVLSQHLERIETTTLATETEPTEDEGVTTDSSESLEQEECIPLTKKRAYQ